MNNTEWLAMAKRYGVLVSSKVNTDLIPCMVCNENKLFGFTYIHNQAKTIFVCGEYLIKSKKEKELS